MPNRTTVFVSYSHTNRRWLERLRIHLKPYDRRGELDLWDDSKIDPGARWQASIAAAIDRAAVSVVLISADFLASDFVVIHELPKLLQKAKLAGVGIMPIIVEPCELTTHPELSSFQALNPPSKPLAAMPRVAAERVLARAGEAIGRILNATAPPQQGPPKNPPGTSTTMFEGLLSTTVALSVLWALARDNGEYTLSELEARLGIRSRKRAFEELNRLSAEGWVEKLKKAGLTKYRLTTEGARQLKQLAAATDGPVRRATAPS